MSPSQWLTQINAIDGIFLLYNTLVLVLILLFGSARPDYFALIGWHAALFALVVVVVVWQNRLSDTLSRLIRIAYPVILLPLVHYESGLLSPLVTEGYFDSWFVFLDYAIFGSAIYTWWAPSWGSVLLDELMSGAYLSLYFIILGLCVGTYLWRRRMMLELIFVLTSCMYAHYFFFILFPVVGPTLQHAALFAGKSSPLTSLVHNVILQGDTAGGAFPSSHCAATILLNYYAGRIFGWRVALLLAPVTILVALATVYLSMHYAVDTIAGLLTGGLFAWGGARLYRRVSKPFAWRERWEEFVAWTS